MNLDLENIRKYGGLEFLAKNVVEGFITGLHKSPFHGFSVEFAEHRLYNKGESTKNIDWKLYARTDKLFVKRYEEETNLRCRVIVDCSSSMYFPEKDNSDVEDLNKIGFSCYSAAAITNLLSRQRDAVGLSAFDDKIEMHTECKSSTLHIKRMYDELSDLIFKSKTTRDHKTNTIETLHEIAERIHRRSLVVIFTDMMNTGSLNDDKKLDDTFSALQHLKHNKHEVILFHVLDNKLEIDLEFANRPYQFVDLETGESVKLNPAQFAEKYKAASQKFHKEIEYRCGQNGVDYVAADINDGFEQVLLPYLLKRSKMY